MSNPFDDNPKQHALTLLQENRLQDALAVCESVTERFPTDAEAWCMLGAIHGMLGAHARAIGACRRAISLRPQYAEAWCNLGASLADLDRTSEAIDAYRQALALEPAYAGVLYNLGNLYRKLGHVDDAIAQYRSALAVGANDPSILLNLGLALADGGRFTEAIEKYRAALARDPNYAEAYNNLGIAWAALDQTDEALSAYAQALRCKPDYAEALNNLGVALSARGNITAAVDSLRAALRSRPDFAQAHAGLGNALLKCGQQQDAIACYRTAIQLNPVDTTAHSNLLFALNYDPTLTPEAIAAEHRRWGATQAATSARSAPKRSGTRPLRIGYVSPDFRAHSVAHFIAPVLAHHDEQALEVYCYANLRRPDAVSDRLRTLAQHWRPIYGLRDEQVAEMIDADAIDVLVDLAGHSADNRLGLFARRAAPLQASYLGYPNTTGLTSIDYYLTDTWLDPPDVADSLYSEKLLRLPLFCCYEPPPHAPTVAPAPATATGAITFGALHNLAKINTDVIRVWSEILRALPASRLLMQSATFADDAIRQDWLHRFDAQGIGAHRLALRRQTSFVDHLQLHAEIDIALDTFPWSGHTTTCHTLWMGVPVVALQGRAHAGRMSATILRAIGLPELIANDERGYVEIAVALAQDPERMNDLRHALRNRMTTSLLCDAASHARSLEAAYFKVSSQRE